MSRQRPGPACATWTMSALPGSALDSAGRRERDDRILQETEPGKTRHANIAGKAGRLRPGDTFNE